MFVTDHLGLVLGTARRRLRLLLRIAQGGWLDGLVGVLCRPCARAGVTCQRGRASLLMRDAITRMRNAITRMRNAIKLMRNAISACNSTHLFLSFTLGTRRGGGLLHLMRPAISRTQHALRGPSRDKVGLEPCTRLIEARMQAHESHGI